MTEMVATQIYGKNLQKSSSAEPETARPFKGKFYVEPHWEGGKKGLYIWSRSDYKEGSHAHIW